LLKRYACQYQGKSEAIAGPLTVAAGSYSAILHESSEVLEGAVIGRLPFFVEAAPGKFPGPKVVGNAFAANPFS